ncbi:hypothetical protein [uncultured Nevskia sp.]|uniref:hypothetical protein n=1 Tax=uncultured Nevskia sp. TaxID=228950 RepID=UPI0025CEA278|nr:hypothetical protein [uncultured Nevskia sp.]
MKKSLLVLLLASAVLAACDGGGSAAPAPPPATDGPTGPALAAVVNDAFAQTSETALPFDINVLDIDPSDETPTLYDGLLV